MSLQSAQNNITHPFKLDGDFFVSDNEVIADIDARSGALVPYTLMAYNPTNDEWVPWTVASGIDGTQYPSGILMATYTEAEIQAGPITDVPIIVGGRGAVIDLSQLVIENSLTLATIITVPTNNAQNAEQHLRSLGIFVQVTTPRSNFQNA